MGFQYNLFEPVIILMVNKAYAVHVCNLADRQKHYTSFFIYYETINGVLWHNVNKVQHSQTTLRHFNSSLFPLLRLLILYKHRSSHIATQLSFSICLQIYLHTLKWDRVDTSTEMHLHTDSINTIYINIRWTKSAVSCYSAVLNQNLHGMFFQTKTNKQRLIKHIL